MRAAMNLYNVIAVIEIEGTPVPNYYSVNIIQGFNSHHEFSVSLPHEVMETKGDFSLKNVKNHVGKVVIIRFQKGVKGKTLNEFKGIITDISIQQINAYQSQIVLHGYS